MLFRSRHNHVYAAKITIVRVADLVAQYALWIEVCKADNFGSLIDISGRVARCIHANAKYAYFKLSCGLIEPSMTYRLPNG
jgi:hypothetical protein